MIRFCTIQLKQDQYLLNIIEQIAEEDTDESVRRIAHNYIYKYHRLFVIPLKKAPAEEESDEPLIEEPPIL